MNLRDLKYILALAETRHFGRAAARCFVSQPTLSGQVKKLEEALGVVIFERTNRAVEITPVGATILHHARLLMEQADAIEQAARAHQDPLAGPLRVGAIPTLSPYLVPLLLIPLRERYPQLRLVLIEEMTDALLKRLSAHEIDAALLATAVPDPDLSSVALFDEPFWLAHPRTHPLADKADINADDLARIDLLLLSEGHCLSHQVMEVCHLANRPREGEMADLRAASLETLLQLVAAGFGCTLVPALAIDDGGRAGGDHDPDHFPGPAIERLRIRDGGRTDGGIVVRRLDLPDAYRRVALVARRSFPRRAALDAFASVLCAELPARVRPLCP